MASIKLKFRPSLVSGEAGSIYYRIIHNRIARQITTPFKIYECEWDINSSTISCRSNNPKRKKYLLSTQIRVEKDISHLCRIVASFEQKGTPFTADDIVTAFGKAEYYLSVFMKGVIDTLMQIGKIRTAETYISALNCFMRFHNNNDILIDDITPELMLQYEAYLRDKGVSPNTSSFYMRILRATYNRAADKNLTTQRFPFRCVYTGVDKTIKRAVSLKTIKRIKELNISNFPNCDFARDMFLFSFYTRGMSFVDMAYLRKKDLKNGILSYRRRKTGQQLTIRWEKCMQEIADKYRRAGSQYLLPIIDENCGIEERKQYINASHSINKNLKLIGEMLRITTPLTMYVARHSWASIAKSKNIPLSVISEGMGHDSESTTRIYLASLDNTAIDKANNLILKACSIN